jgi:hypothetical protein
MSSWELSGENEVRRRWFGLGAILSLVVCLGAPVLYFLGAVSQSQYKLILALASVGWFILATLWAGAGKKAP